MFCRKCGKQIPDDSEFCPVCGKQTKQMDDSLKANSIDKGLEGTEPVSESQGSVSSKTAVAKNTQSGGYWSDSEILGICDGIAVLCSFITIYSTITYEPNHIPIVLFLFSVLASVFSIIVIIKGISRKKSKDAFGKKFSRVCMIVAGIVIVLVVVCFVIFITKHNKSILDKYENIKESTNETQTPSPEPEIVDNTWSIVNVTDSFGDAVDGKFTMDSTFDGTATDVNNRTVDVSVAVGIAEHPENNTNMFKGFTMSFTIVSKANGQPFVYSGTDATIEIKSENKKYTLFGSISGNSILLNAVADFNDYIPTSAVENSMNTQELLQLIYKTDTDIDFALNGTCVFTFHKGNFNEVFDGAEWRNPAWVTGKKKNTK